jgi:hypothetical protein
MIAMRCEVGTASTISICRPALQSVTVYLLDLNVNWWCEAPCRLA